MSCTTDVCGVGNWSGPRPGDPDNNAVLSANGVFGGIEVSWTYPNTNSHAVAHTLLYRSIGDRFETAIQTAIVSGNQFFDRNTTDPIRTYYYWIRFVSINGTLMEPIGPATGYALDDLDRVIEGMAGKIEAGFLATSLRSRIDKIADLEVGVTNLSQTITDESGILSQTLLGVQSDIDATLAYYEEEREARLLADGALASAINTTVAQAKNELYAAVQESTDAQALVNGDLSAKYSVKVDLAGNVAGFGLASSGNVYDETIHSEFGVQADSFWVSGPSTVSATEPLTNLYHGRVWVDTSNAQNPVTKYYNKTTALWQTTVVKGSVPFIVKTTEDPVTGAPAGVYIDSAYISSITANRIDARGLVIRDTPENGGGILFGAGNALDWSKIGGSAKPADGATRNEYQGLWATAKAYYVGDTVLDSTGYGWACLKDHTSSSTIKPPVYPTESNTYWGIYVVKGQNGKDGIDGIPGKDGTNGTTYYTWIKYADSPTTGMSDYPADKLYIGIAYNKTTATESTTYADYNWSLIKGKDGLAGKDGTNGVTTYTWIKYADDASGTDISDSPTGKLYIGLAVNKTTATESTVATDYTWALIQGPKGDTGAKGNTGAKGDTGVGLNTSNILSVATSGTVYVPGIRVGDLAWNASGERTSGKGLALTPTGLLGHNGDKTTFTVDATTGDATFSGILNVAGATSGARLEITNNVIKVFDSLGTLRVKLGNLA